MAALCTLRAGGAARAQDGFQAVRPAPVPRQPRPAGTAPTTTTPPHWLIGRWEGDVANFNDARFGGHRIMTISAVDPQGQVTGEWGSQRSSPAPVLITFDGAVVTLTTPQSVIVTLRPVTSDRLEGSFVVQAGPQRGS
jgi:hypothetical protein